MHHAYIGLGSNLDNPVSQIQSAIAALAQIEQTQLLKTSRLYQTKPVGFTEQADFINACVMLETKLSAQALLENMQAIEDKHGRVRICKNGPRTLDCDLLLFDKQIINTKTLTVPHPRMTQRQFVLQPLHEIAPDLQMPDGTAITDLADLTCLP